MGRRGLAALVGLVLLAVAGYVGWRVIEDTVGPFLSGEECTGTVDGNEVTLSVEQAENAALITAISVQRGMPARAATIATHSACSSSARRRGGARESRS